MTVCHAYDDYDNIPPIPLLQDDSSSSKKKKTSLSDKYSDKYSFEGTWKFIPYFSRIEASPESMPVPSNKSQVPAVGVALQYTQHRRGHGQVVHPYARVPRRTHSSHMPKGGKASLTSRDVDTSHRSPPHTGECAAQFIRMFRQTCSR